MRHWYGTWNFGGGTLLVGQTWTPDFSAIGGLAYGCGILGNFGDFGGSARQRMIQVQFGGLKIALMNPAVSTATTRVVGTAGDQDSTLPKLNISYSLKAGPAAIKVWGGYNTYDEVVTATDKGYSIASWVVGGNFNIALGAAYIKGTLWTAENANNYGLDAGGFSAYYDSTSDSIKDAKDTGYGLVVGFKASPMIKIEAGYFAAKSELDRTGDWEDEKCGYYLSMPITLAKGVSITPEYAVMDNKDIIQAGAKTEQGETTVYGVYWKIAF